MNLSYNLYCLFVPFVLKIFRVTLNRKSPLSCVFALCFSARKWKAERVNIDDSQCVEILNDTEGMSNSGGVYE